MIRPVTPEDAPAIAAIYNEYVTAGTATFEVAPLTDKQMRERICALSARYPYYVYETDGHIGGYCYAHPWKERAAYAHTMETTVYLAARHTGKGIGKRLMETLAEECRRRGYHALIACITAENTASCAFHEALGFRKVSHFHEVGRKFGRWLDVADYELLL